MFTSIIRATTRDCPYNIFDGITTRDCPYNIFDGITTRDYPTIFLMGQPQGIAPTEF